MKMKFDRNYVIWKPFAKYSNHYISWLTTFRIMIYNDFYDLGMLKLRMYLYLLIGYLLQVLQVVWTEILLKTGCNISLSINDVEV